MYVFSQRLSIIISVFFLTTSSVQAGDTTSYKFPGISVIGNKITSADIIPGTVNIVSKEIIQLSKGVNGTQALETVPGLNIVDEEGVGLRMNLSIRGLDPDRSRSVLVLEDGVPTALAPYGEPEMYYTPLMDRMSGVEIIKGSGSIGYGPQTIGGVVNFLTNEPGDLRGFTLKMGGGNGEYLNSKLSYGTTGSNYGILLEYNRKSANNLELQGLMLMM